MNPKIHRTTVRVIYGDTDAGRVVYNANYLRYFEIGRTELMRKWICSYSEIERQGFILPVVECHIRYKAPAYYDDLLVIETSIAELSKIKCRFNCRILREEEGREKLLAKGYTIHVAVDKNGKLVRLPDGVMNKLGHLVLSR
ncbi:MAG: thioesterase [Deltaproteobacteria bacterium]|nr:MAG: thioesterase [Deltaproteobacteria bacterium]